MRIKIGGRIFEQGHSGAFSQNLLLWVHLPFNMKIMPQIRWLVTGIPQQWPGFDPKHHVGLVMEKVALGQDLSKCFAFLGNYHSTNCFTFINHLLINAI